MTDKKSVEERKGNIFDTISGFGTVIGVSRVTSLDVLLNEKITEKIIESSVYFEDWTLVGEYLVDGVEMFAHSGVPGYFPILVAGALCAEAFKYMNFPTKSIVRGIKHVLT